MNVFGRLMKMGNSILKKSNWKKAFYYLKKNGPKSAYYAVTERLAREKAANYSYREPSEEEKKQQRKEAERYPYTFSILVPAYETNPEYLREMVDSVLNQTYSRLELIVADASASGRVKEVIETYDDKRLRYVRIAENKGISANTNAALAKSEGEYVGLLDHDDVLTPDALYEMAKAIAENEKNGNTAWMLYSDEDKGNGDCTEFYEPHFKPDLNVDLLLSNNYVCHFLVMKSSLIKTLGFRPEYDGAQDFDLVLRATGRLLYETKDQRRDLMRECENAGRTAVVHVPKVLYHWRCHTQSTAENPESKRYAYDAGRRAVQDFINSCGWKASVSDSRHLGFYRITYEGGIFSQRPEVGVIGGKILKTGGKIAGGIYDENGVSIYEGLHKEYSGYMHRATLLQEAYAVDVRCMKVKKELWSLFEETFGIPYAENERTGYCMWSGIGAENTVLRELSMDFCKRVRKMGYTVVFMPEASVKITAQ
ncbi:glycosyltransferase family 2 protein [Kineothrix sedimenti]|uniref:Glycosyltransferase n=1 Tax=Kineothrix sedimenti TaxID=3123317 RepID=A0ABZ3EVU2_9FIRM